MNCCLPKKPSKGLSFSDKTKCQVHLAKMADINYMMQRAIGGDMSVFKATQYMDITGLPDSMQEMLNCQRRALEAFEALPDDVRRRFATPQLFLEAASTPEGRQEFVKYGLAFERKENGPIEVRVINPVSPKGPEPSTGSACA